MTKLKSKQTSDHEQVEFCHICDKAHDGPDLTGQNRGAAQDKYNLKFQALDFITVVIPYFRGYDSHIIFEAFGDFEIKSRLKLDNYIKVGSK